VTETLAPESTSPAAPKSLLARLVGVIFSPRATYAAVAAQPRVLGALLVVVLIIGGAIFAFMSTEVGRNAVLDQQLSAMESFGVRMSDAQIAQMEDRVSSTGRYFAVISQAIAIPLMTLVVAGIGLAIFNAVMGGNATFKQVYAIVAHSWFLPAIQTLFVLPLNYARESMSSSTSLAIFLPMIDDATFFGRLLGMIDLFRVWWIVSLAIGFGVLYKRRTAPIAWSFLALYAVISLVVAGVMTALSGA
jgi:hypothetical protein